MDFKKGDRVMCIDDTNYGGVRKYEIYTVYSITDTEHFMLAHYNFRFYKKNRFILATKASKILFGGK